MRLGVARKNDDAAGDLVETVDDPHFSVFGFEHFDEIRRVFFPSVGKDGQACGLVEDNDVFVEVEDVHILILLYEERAP